MSYVPVNWEESLRRECFRRRLSPRTFETYHYCISKFLDWAGKDLGKISKKDVREFLSRMAERGLSGSSMNTYHMAIRFLFEEVLDKRIWIDIKYSKTPKRMPLVLSKEEVRRLIGAIGNDKHRLMIELMYGAGLRVSELVNLKICDLEVDKGYGFVRNGKGGKDRLFVIPERLKERIIGEVGGSLNKERFLFLSGRGGEYSVKSIQEILKSAARNAKIDKKVHPHTLRHSFATHLIENGSSVSEVQAMLGHKSPETTMIYVHMASPSLIKIKSPLDELGVDEK